MTAACAATACRSTATWSSPPPRRRKLFGLFPRKGTIAVGSDADIVLFDPDETWTIRAAEHRSRVEYSMFEGREVTGRVSKVFLRGELIVDGREWLGREGGGQFIKRGQAGKQK